MSRDWLFWEHGGLLGKRGAVLGKGSWGRAGSAAGIETFLGLLVGDFVAFGFSFLLFGDLRSGVIGLVSLSLGGKSGRICS